VRTDDRAFKLDERAKKKSTAYTFDMGRFGSPDGPTRVTMGTSQSGHERNHLFLNEKGQGAGEAFRDVSGVSGLDSDADGRAFAILDLDRDGFSDLAVVGSNRPLFQLFRNRMGEGRAANLVGLRFVGGNRSAAPSDTWSARDAYGARVTLELSRETLLRAHRSSEGMAAQNSATLVVGLGADERVRKLTVHWPSGRTQTFEDLPAGELYTLHEDAATSPDGSGLEREPYVRASGPLPVAAAAKKRSLRLTQPSDAGSTGPPLLMYVTMATTCEACHEELPDLAHLRETLKDDLAMFGVPTARYGGADGTEDSREVLVDWEQRLTPAYELLVDVTRAEVDTVNRLVAEELDYDGYSATIVTDRAGNVLLMRVGEVTVSDLRKLLRELDPERS
jgi:hypothetical protein